MKATGIVRRIDELGRVVIPKEIRRILRIREGDPLEIFTETDGTIMLKKYSHIGEMSKFAQKYADVLAQNSGHKIAIADRDVIVAVAGGMPREYVGKNVSKPLEMLMKDRVSLSTLKGNKAIDIIEGENTTSKEQQIVQPILGDCDIVGSVILVQKEGNTPLSEIEQKLVLVAANFLGKQMEE
ncbi:MAG: AbrB/MazE/SpoVT family DNA-binding domain-containing protein [Lachnospiraceae bacterium]|nr:AbrB/MazE/SpoVT family DNA-binding domain-containing protein [Lachnospiraceae bacterium]